MSTWYVHYMHDILYNDVVMGQNREISTDQCVSWPPVLLKGKNLVPHQLILIFTPIKQLLLHYTVYILLHYMCYTDENKENSKPSTPVKLQSPMVNYYIHIQIIYFDSCVFLIE